MIKQQQKIQRGLLLGSAFILLLLAFMPVQLELWVVRGLLILLALAVSVVFFFTVRTVQSPQNGAVIKPDNAPSFNPYQIIEEAVFVITITRQAIKQSPVLQFYAVNAAVRRFVGAPVPLSHTVDEKELCKCLDTQRLDKLRHHCVECMNVKGLVEYEDEQPTEHTWWSVRLVPSEEEGTLIGIAVDVTASKRIITVLRQSEEKFSATMNAMTEGLVIQDPAGAITFSNPGAEQILGLTRDQLLGRTLVDPRWRSIHEDGSPFPGETHPAIMVLKTGKPQRNVVMGVHKPDDSLTWILINSQPIVMPDGVTISAAVTSFSDITTYITSIAALREQERLYSTLVGNLPGMVYRSFNDEQWTMVYVSSGVLDLTGYTDQDLLHNRSIAFYDLVLPEYRDWLWKKCQDALERRIPCQSTYPIRHKSGEIRWVYDRAAGIYDEQGMPASVEGFIQDITEQKLIDEQFHESEARYRRLFTIMEEGVAINELVFDDEGKVCDYKILDISDAFERHALLKTQDVLGKTATELYQMTPAYIYNWWLEHSQRTESARVDFYHEPTGMWFDIVTTPIEGNQFATIFTNITQRKQAEEQLRQQATLLQFISDAVITTDVGLRITSWNEAAITMYGWNTSEVLGQTVDELLQTVFVESTQPEVQKKLTTTGVWQGKIYQTTKSGKKIILDSAVTWLNDGKEGILGGIAINRDITDRVHAEDTVRRLNNLLSDASTMAQFGAFEVEIPHNTVTASAQVYTILDLDPTQPLPRAEEILESLQFISDDVTRDQLEDLLRYGGELDIEIGLQTVSDTMRWIRIIAHTEMREQKPVRLYGALQDNTERRRIQEEIRQLNLDLERRVKERTQELVKLNQEKDEFLGIAAHDLKNPLSGIRSSAELIEYYLANNKPEHVNRFARTIMQACEQMVNIINRFLDIHKIETGAIDLQIEPHSTEILETLVFDYQERAAQKGIIVQLVLPIPPPKVAADKQAFREIFDNLLSNAIKYSPSWKRVFVQVQPVNGTTPHVRFMVQDEGPGLTEADKERLFTKFARLSAKPTANEHSTGLGLSIVKKLVEMQNGAVWCESTAGKGATFIVELPAAP